MKGFLAAVLTYAAFIIPAPAHASQFDTCYDTVDDDQVCMMLIDDGEYTVAIKDTEYYWPTTMHLTCFDDGTNDYEAYGSIPADTLDAYANGVCDSI